MQSFHVKVSCNDQFRRFLFVGTEFSSLYTQVQQLLALDKEFVLKYKDNEGDLITLASNEELACALNYSEGTILRLVATPKDAPVTTKTEVPVCSRESPFARRGGRGGRCHGRGGPHHGPGSDMFKAKWLSKVDYFKSQLSELEKIPEKNPEQQREFLRLQKKLKKLEFLIEGGWEKKGKQGAKWEEKKEKKREKMEKRMRKREQKDKRPVSQLSEEAQTQIAMMKSQIDLLKPLMNEVKGQIKAKKEELKEAKEMGRDPNQLLKELLVWKETRDAQKMVFKPLKQKIRELKYAS